MKKSFIKIQRKRISFKRKIDPIKKIWLYNNRLTSCLGPITINTLSASTSVLIPIQCEFFALEGLAQLLNTIKLVKQTIKSIFTNKRFYQTMYSSQNNLSKQVFAI